MNKELIIGLVGLTLIGLFVINNQTRHCVFVDPITTEEFDVYTRSNDFKMENEETSILSKNGIVYFWTSTSSDGLKFPYDKLGYYGFRDIKDSFVEDNLGNCSRVANNFLLIPTDIDFYDPSDGFFGPSINFEYKND